MWRLLPEHVSKLLVSKRVPVFLCGRDGQVEPSDAVTAMLLYKSVAVRVVLP
jgi:hypothetical protein